jgi:hypothetical protein
VILTESEGGKQKVTGLASVPKGVKVLPQVNPSVFFSLDPDEFDPTVFAGLSDGLKAMIQKSPEYEEIVSGPSFSDVKTDDDIPF